MASSLRPIVGALCGLLFVASRVLGAPPPPTNEDVEALKKQIQALVAGQIAIQKQLDEIKGMLRAAPAAAAPAPGPVGIVDTVIETAGAASKGAATAKVAVVEFSDYECPFCGRYVRDALPQIARDYIDTGKVRYVFRNFPLDSIHKSAFKAAVAAGCAADQGKGWPMHDQLFANQTALDAPALIGHGKAIGLDAARFEQCLTTDAAAPRVRQDQADAQKAGASSTPTFFVAVTTPGDSKVRAVRMIRGAQAYPTFKGAIDSVLASAK
jgi:protein-disulfide isomerase